MHRCFFQETDAERLKENKTALMQQHHETDTSATLIGLYGWISCDKIRKTHQASSFFILVVPTATA
jgi:hypothetical protein